MAGGKVEGMGSADSFGVGFPPWVLPCVFAAVAVHAVPTSAGPAFVMVVLFDARSAVTGVLLREASFDCDMQPAVLSVLAGVN